MTTLIRFIFLLVLPIGCSNRVSWPELTLSETSPNKDYTVKVVEKVRKTFDRNFRVVLVNKQGAEKVIFESPDEDRPGGEQLYWSADSQSFILTGPTFIVNPSSELKNGERLYLYYRISEDRLYCNATQTENYEGFSCSDLVGVDYKVSSSGRRLTCEHK